MTLDDYCKWIPRKLGAPLVRVELTQEQLMDAVVDAFEEVNPYIADSSFVTIPFNNRTDMSEYKVEYIVEVYRTPTDQLVMTEIGFDQSLDEWVAQEAMLRGARTKLQNALKARVSHKFIPPYLYIDLAAPLPAAVTIEYVPNIATIEDVKDPYWESLLKQLALANAKEVLGRIRSKFVATGQAPQTDGQTLLSEASSSHDVIRRKLNEEYYTFFPTD